MSSSAPHPTWFARHWKSMTAVGSLAAITVVIFTTDLVFGGADGADGDYPTEIIRSGPLKITVVAKGQVESMNNAVLKNQSKSSVRIVKIVAEGTAVKAPLKSKVEGTIEDVTIHDPMSAGMSKQAVITVREPWGDAHTYTVAIEGLTEVAVDVDQYVRKDTVLAGDLVCTLDASALEDAVKQQEIKLTTAKAALFQAEENLAIQRTQNESDIAAAKLKLTLARLDLEKYEDGEYTQKVNEIEGEVTLAEEQLAKAQEEYQFTLRLAKKGYRGQDQVEAASLAVTKAQISLQLAEEKLRVLKKYDYKRTIAELKANAVDLERELLRTERKGRSAESQYVADVAARLLTAQVEESQYERMLAQIRACRMFAPQAGEVVYANNQGRRGQELVIEEQATVGPLQHIIKLPDLKNMKIDAKIHESKINLVRVGQAVLIRLEAFPDRVFSGVVDMVAAVPESGNWFNSALKEYATEIRILGKGDAKGKLKPGLNANIEIIAMQKKDAIQAPVQAIVGVGRKYYSFVRTTDGIVEREVKIGDASESALEILDGLAVGDEVVTAPRTYLGARISKLQAKAKSDGSAEKQAADAVKEANGAAKPSGKQGGDRRAGGSGQRPDPAKMFAQMDKDGDGKLTKEEAPAQMKSYFDHLDADKDGSVTKEEFTKAMAKFSAGRGGAAGAGGGGAGGPGRRGGGPGGGRGGQPRS